MVFLAFPYFPSKPSWYQSSCSTSPLESPRDFAPKAPEKRVSGEEQEDMRPSPSTSSSSVLQRLVDSASVYAALA